MSATTETRLLTAEEFLALYEEEPAELSRGEVVHLAPPGYGRAQTGTRIIGPLYAWCEQTGLGEVIDETGIILSRSPDTVRAPDVVFYVAGRAPHPDEQGYLETIPDLVVEVAFGVMPRLTCLARPECGSTTASAKSGWSGRGPSRSR